MGNAIGAIRKNIILATIVLASFFMVGRIEAVEVQAAQVQDVVIVNTSDVNVRSNPSTNGKKLGKLQYGTYLNRYETRSDGWSYIDYNGKDAYVKSEFLTASGLAMLPAATATGTMAATTAIASTPVTNDSSSTGGMVWLSATGNCYHSINNCGRMNPNKARQVPLSDAQKKYSRCSKCW